MTGVAAAAGVNDGPIGELQPWLLLVEDSAHDRELALHALRRGRFPGRVEAARDGVEALDRLLCRGPFAGRDQHDLPRAVLCDIKMPMLSGIDVLREVRADPVLSEVPVVMMTSSAEEGDLETCYALGANSYIVKPVEIEPYFETVLDIGRYWLVHNQPPRDHRVALAGGGR